MTTTYLLIPGAGGNSAWYWQCLVAELDRRGQETIAVELPAADDSAGLAEYVDAVVRAAGERTDLVVVAQSLGGLTAPLVCDRLPVRRLVLVNAMIPVPGESGGEWWANTGSGEARRDCDRREGRDPDGPFDPMVYFFHDVPEDLTKEGMSAEPRQSDTPMGQPWPREEWPDVPTSVICGREDRLFPVDFQTRVAEDRLGITPMVLPGGHLIALSNPVELADALVSLG